MSGILSIHLERGNNATLFPGRSCSLAASRAALLGKNKKATCDWQKHCLAVAAQAESLSLGLASDLLCDLGQEAL